MQQLFRHKLATFLCCMSIPFLVAGCSTSTSPNGTYETGMVTEALVTDTIESSGTVSARQMVTLSWTTSGIVEKVTIQNNDTVVSGEILMTLDSKTAPSNVINAISTLITAKQELENIQSSTTNLAKARIALIDAQTTYNEALIAYNGLNQPIGSEEYIAILQKNYINAQNQTTRAIKNYNRDADYEEDSVARATALANLSQAKINEHDALIRLNHFSNPPDAVEAARITSEYHLAKSKLDEAQKNYAQLKDGNVDAVNKAQTAVNAAQATVNKLSIIAPFDGQAAFVYTQPGDMVAAGTKAVVIYDRSKMTIDVLVTEDSISKVKVGNPVDVSFTGLNIETTGKVTLIDPIGASSSGVVNYTVRIELDDPDPQIYIGATASVVITTGEPQNRIYVPVSAVMNDIQGEYVVKLNNDGSTERVQVVTGDISDETVAVAGELSKGDRVELFTSASASEPTDQGRGGLFGGMGGILR